MILLVHHRGRRVVKVERDGASILYMNHSPALALFELAENYPEELIVWCEERFESGVYAIKWQEIIKDRSFLASYSCSGRIFLPEEIGFVDTSVFTKVRRDVPFATWIMSGDRGVIHAKTLFAFKEVDISVDNFDYFLSSLAKIGMPQGLLAYSDPRLSFSSKIPETKYSQNNDHLYGFVRAHYRKRWLMLLFAQQLIYQQKMPILSFLNAIFKAEKTDLKSIVPFYNNNNNNRNNNKRVDVLIPTIGRKDYLHDVLLDLKNQTILPQKVIIVEQNPEPDSSTQLDYLTAEDWPFEIDHSFIHKTGACNARNIALEKVTSEWVFFADDDIRIPTDFLENACDFIATGDPRAFTVSCLREGEREPIKQVIQWRTFGSGCSFVKAAYLQDVRFDLAFEGGFGEDADFGMQLRNKGIDIVYNPFLKLTHLKAPVGGFRHKVKHPWDDEKFPPKPSPTVMVYQLKHATYIQQCGFKTVLFLKFFFRQSNKNPFTYFRSMQKRWKTSIKWANILINQNK